MKKEIPINELSSGMILINEFDTPMNWTEGKVEKVYKLFELSQYTWIKVRLNSGRIYEFSVNADKTKSVVINQAL